MTTCVQCHGPLPKRRRKYCSAVCSRFYFEQVIAPLWWSNARNMALKRANHRCEECGGKTKLDVHHVVYLEPGEPRHNSRKNTQSNLIVLCRQHHEHAHHPAKSDWSPAINEAHHQIALPLEAP